MKMVYFPESSGLSPRPYDAYDRLCYRYYLAKSPEVRIECERQLKSEYGSDVGDLDYDYTHGRTLVHSCEIRSV